MAATTDFRVRAARIRKARRDMPFESGRRVSQESFARKLNVHWVTVSSWERGKAQPNLENIHAVAEVTGKPVEYFFGDDEDEESALRRLAAEAVLLGHDDMATDLMALARRRHEVDA